MRRVGIIFIGAVLLPSLVLAWLALRSLKDHELAFERQEHLVWQGVADQTAARIRSFIDQLQADFGEHVEGLLNRHGLDSVKYRFDSLLQADWSLAQVGFAVSTEGQVFAPSLLDRMEAREFRLANDDFLCNAESVEVFWNSPKGRINLTELDREESARVETNSPAQGAELWLNLKNQAEPKPSRKVVLANAADPAGPSDPPSTLVATEAAFRELVGNAQEGVVARFLQNRLHVLLWYRSHQHPSIIFGAQLHLPQLAQHLVPLVRLDQGATSRLPALVALLDHQTRPVAVHPAGALASWKHPFAAAEIGEALPHWELALYWQDPRRLTESARATAWIVGLLVALLLVAIAVGSWLITADVRRELLLARQKTDFVSNVSHELKTPLTSIRMFAELLADPAAPPGPQRLEYLGIIQREAQRLTRLINNILDFARLERGEEPYARSTCDLAAIARQTLDTCRPHLLARGFTLSDSIPAQPLPVEGDADALARLILNLISNAEKYAGQPGDILVELDPPHPATGHAELRVLDRGPGVPAGLEEKIFEKFFRAHDTLNSGTAGSGLGLTLARRIALAHGGDLVYRPRPGGGSIFAFRCPTRGAGESMDQEG